MTTAVAEPVTAAPASEAGVPSASAYALSIAILGGGPAGSTLAALMADRGMRVVLFDDEKRPDLIVGESLIPALVPIFRRLGIEEEVAQIGVVKPGVTFLMANGDGEPLHLSFKPLRNRLPQYAYNVPRPQFDDLLRSRARRGGVHVIRSQAKLTRDPEHADVIRLAPETMAMATAFEGRQPDLIVDCTGRKRTIARMMDIPTEDGPRRDVAHFAHFQGFDLSGLPAGQVITGIMRKGWSWAIPLRDCVSVGMVMNHEDARAFGKTPEEQLAGAMAADPHLGPRSRDVRRVTDVMTYTNYQKIGARGHGANWVLLGDAFGFVDPLFSPGLFLAMRSAELLTDQIDSLPVHSLRQQGLVSPVAHPRFQQALSRYDAEMQDWFRAWMELIELIYSGKILALREAGMEWTMSYPGWLSNWISNHMECQMACMAAGEATRSRYAWSLLRFGTRYGMRGKDSGKYRIN